MPPLPYEAASIGGFLLPALLSAAVLAALLTACANLVLAVRKTREEERARVRTTLSDAYSAYTEYREFPYAIRRRQAETPAEERIRLSEDLRRIQARVAFYLAWTNAESTVTGTAYEQLIEAARRVAGAAMHDAWTAPACDADASMNIPPEVVHLQQLAGPESAFMSAAKVHVESLTRHRWRLMAGG